MKSLRWCIPVLCVLALVSFARCSSSTSTAVTPPKSWTLIIYMDGDNDLESDFIDGFLKMAQIGSDANVNIVVQFDRSPRNDQRYGDWADANRFYITSGLTPTVANAVPDWGDGQGGREVDMANPETLTAFMNWAVENYPADMYALIIGDHGEAWAGVCLDETSGDYWMYPTEIREAVQAAQVAVDLIGFDACLMATMDTAWQMRDTGAAVMVGSEASAYTWPWDLILEGLVKNPFWGPKELGPWINQCYIQQYAAKPNMTHSTLDLAHVPALTTALRDFTNKCLNGADIADIHQAAFAAQQQIETCVIFSDASPDRDDAHGVTVFFPQAVQGPHGTMEFPNDWSFYTGKLTPFANAGKWRAFLNATFPMGGRDLPYQVTDARERIEKTFENKTIVDLYHYLEILIQL
ncbi:MAG: clostripain-related cysteine peptidase [Thermodesulfobacteriota bacterium]